MKYFYLNNRFFYGKSILILFLCLFDNIIFAQQQIPPSILWEKCYGDSGDDEATSIQQTLDSGYIVAGFSNSTYGEVIGNHGGYDYWILKLDQNGIIQWKNSFGGIGNEEAYSIQQIKDSGYIVAGYSDSNSDEVTGNHGREDVWIIKIDKFGSILWENSFGGNGTDAAYNIQQTLDDGYIIAGVTSTNDNGDVMGYHYSSYGSYDYWVIKLDSLGIKQWAKCFGGNSTDQGYYILQTMDSGYIIAGYSSSNNGDVEGNHGNADYWIVKLDNYGNILWEKSYGGSNDDEASCIQQTNDGGYIIAGWTSSNDYNVTGYHGGQDYWIVKINDTGKIIWEKCYGGSGQDIANYIQQTKDGGFIIAGFSNSIDGDVSGNKGGTNYWIVKIDTLGNLQWEKSYGGIGNNCNDIANSIQQTNDGGYIIGGTTNSINGDVTDNHGGYDYWIVKLAFIPLISSSKQQVLSRYICKSNLFDTFWIYNVGSAPLEISNVTFTNNQYYSFISPSTSVSILSKDSLQFIIRLNPILTDSFSINVNIYSNDTLTGHNPWQVNFTGTKANIDFTLLNLTNDTLEFGALQCGTTKDSAFYLLNISSIATGFSLQSSNTMFSTLPYLNLDSGAQQSINVHFSGGASGQYFDSIVIIDTCGETKTVYLAATVLPISAPIVTALGATTFCAGDSIRLNAPNGFNTYEWSDGETSQNIIVKKSGAYTVTVTTAAGCTATSTPTTVTVTPLPQISVFMPAPVVVCPFSPDTIPLTITNNDSASESVTYAATGCTLSEQSATLAPGGIDTLLATFAGADTGVYNLQVTVTDECGIAHVIPLTINVHRLPPLTLTLVPDSSSLVIGDELKVFVIASPDSSISGGVTFTVAHEPTALHLDSIVTLCQATKATTNDEKHDNYYKLPGNYQRYDCDVVLPNTFRLHRYAVRAIKKRIDNEHLRYSNWNGQGDPAPTTARLRFGAGDTRAVHVRHQQHLPESEHRHGNGAILHRGAGNRINRFIRSHRQNGKDDCPCPSKARHVHRAILARRFAGRGVFPVSARGALLWGESFSEELSAKN